ncbi:MAG: NAD(P)H-dependent oxidoreductase [Alphaproteobacteria bacterium]|nr:NAD(P)H-dependent oxidoreductase [Alphaproteobacteria bacterium]
MAQVLAICGSLRKGSFNRQLMNASIGLAPEGMTIKEAPSFAKMPIYNFDDQQATGFPKDVDAFHEAVRAADGVLIVSAEYNWSIPGGLKNAIDWLSRYKEVSFKDKPVCLQSAAPGLLGGSRMQYHMRMCMQSVDAILFGKPEVIVNLAASKFADGQLKDQAAIDLIKQQLASFAKFIERVKVR